MHSFIPEIKGLKIELEGDFNPKIFNPAWFSSNNLLMVEEIEKADTNIVHKDIVAFTLDWLNLRVTRDNFTVETLQESHEGIIRDLVVGAFQLLRHTPISSIGITTHAHFRVESIERWNKIGDCLAPKQIWNEVLVAPGMRSLRVQSDRRDDGHRGFIGVKVEPSAKVHPGIFILVLDHFGLSSDGSASGCVEAVNILQNAWEAAVDRAARIKSSLLEGAYASTDK